MEGTFIYITTNEPVDGGVVILDSTGKKMKRVYDSVNGVRPEWWGAKGDGINDDLPAFTAMTAYLMNQSGSKQDFVQLSNAVYRLTNQWVIGQKFIDEDQTFKDILNNPTLDMNKFIISRRVNPISIKGTGASAIYLDFEPDKLTAGIYYAIQGDTRAKNSIESYSAELKDFGIYPKGYFNNGVPTNTINKYNGNKLVGIEFIYNVMVSVDKITFFGLREGVILNNSYFNNITNCTFRYCNRGFYTYQSHASTMSNCVFSFCNLGLEFHSGQLNLTNIYTSSCSVSMYFGWGSSSIIINSSYLESSVTGEAQIIIGENIGDPSYINSSSYVVNGIVFNALTVVANKPSGATGTSIILKDSARKVMINGGSLQSSNKVLTNPSNELIVQGVLGSFPIEANRRDADSNFKSITITDLKAPTGTLKQLYINDKGKIVIQ